MPYICGKCGKISDDEHRGWIIGQRYCYPPGILIIRCPDHIISSEGDDARDLIE